MPLFQQVTCRTEAEAPFVMLSKSTFRVEIGQVFATAICWCNDSFVGHWFSTEHPIGKRMYLDDDPGYAFKLRPIAGKYVADLLEDVVMSSQHLPSVMIGVSPYLK